jgi:hypothetical protein
LGAADETGAVFQELGPGEITYFPFSVSAERKSANDKKIPAAGPFCITEMFIARK